MNNLLTLLFCSLFFAGNIYSQNLTITTICGSNSEGFAGDNGPADSALLSLPMGIGIDKWGNIYIGDWNNVRVRKIDHSSGIITTVAGNGTFGSGGDGGSATLAELRSPSDIAIDSSGNIFIASYDTPKIRMVNGTTGIITRIAGTASQGFYGDGGPATSAWLDHPISVYIDEIRNHIYITDLWNQRIRRVNRSSNIITTIAGNGTAGFSGDGGLATSASLNFPGGVCVDIAGNIYIADYANNRIRKIDVSSGIINTFAGTGTAGFSGDGGLAINAELFSPSRLVFDSTESIMYITDRANNKIRKINMITGIITTIAGNGVAAFSGDGGLATNASLYNPNDLCVDSYGNIYIADPFNYRIRKVSLITAINQNENKSEIKIFPNPAKDYINIFIPNNKVKVLVELQELHGRILKKDNFDGENGKIDISNYSKGIYFVKISSTNGLFIRKFIVE